MSCLSGRMQLAHNYSDGIVPDLHRVPFSSIAGTYSGGKHCRNIAFANSIHSLKKIVKLCGKRFVKQQYSAPAASYPCKKAQPFGPWHCGWGKASRGLAKPDQKTGLPPQFFTVRLQQDYNSSNCWITAQNYCIIKAILYRTCMAAADSNRAKNRTVFHPASAAFAARGGYS